MNIDDRIAAARAENKIRRKEDAEQTKARARELTGEVIRYIPTADGYKVVCGDDNLGHIWE